MNSILVLNLTAAKDNKSGNENCYRTVTNIAANQLQAFKLLHSST